MFFVDRATLSDATENENIQYGSHRNASKYQIKKTQDTRKYGELLAKWKKKKFWSDKWEDMTKTKYKRASINQSW